MEWSTSHYESINQMNTKVFALIPVAMRTMICSGIVIIHNQHHNFNSLKKRFFLIFFSRLKAFLSMFYWHASFIVAIFTSSLSVNVRAIKRFRNEKREQWRIWWKKFCEVPAASLYENLCSDVALKGSFGFDINCGPSVNQLASTWSTCHCRLSLTDAIVVQLSVHLDWDELKTML